MEDQVARWSFRVEPEQQVEPQQRAGNDEVLPDVEGTRRARAHGPLRIQWTNLKCPDPASAASAAYVAGDIPGRHCCHALMPDNRRNDGAEQQTDDSRQSRQTDEAEGRAQGACRPLRQ